MIESPYQPSPDRYDDGMVYRRAGRSGVLLPAFSLGMWHNFGSGQAFSNVQRMAHYASTAESPISTLRTTMGRRTARPRRISAV